MKKTLYRIIVMAALIFSIGNAVLAEPQFIRYQVEPDYPPFKFLQNGRLTGFDVQFSSLLFNTDDYIIDYSYDIWANVYSRLKNGKIDTCGLLSVTEERKKEILYTDPVLQTHFALYSRQNYGKITLSTLKRYKIAAVKGYYTESLLKDKLNITNYLSYQNFDQCIDSLTQRKADIIFGNQEVMNYLLIKRGLTGEIIPRLGDLFAVDFAYGVKKGGEPLVAFLNRRIKKLQKSGVYEELYLKYFFTHSKYYHDTQKNMIIRSIALSIIGLVAIFAFLYLYIQFLKKRIFAANQELMQHHEKINHLAYYDLLTGLPNRTLFMDKLGEALKRAERDGRGGAILFLDLDNFKTVNDTLGHVYGDGLLKEISATLTEHIGEVDIIARLGGDEFILLKEGIGSKEAVAIAAKIFEAFNHPWVLHDREFDITASIGITVYPDDGTDQQTLLRNADTALYRAKEFGKSNWQIYSRAMNDAFLEKMEIEGYLRHAIEKQELVVYYQPQIALHNQTIVGVEALIRWNHPKMGLVSPARFIPLAEESGLIVPIGEWVLRQACEQWKTWRNAGYPLIRVSVNLSPRQFKQGNLIERIETVLAETGMNPEFLDLEITEGIAMDDLDYSVGILKKLKDVGIGISLDDFGKGYSSLNYLRHLPIDTVKIDKTFVDFISKNSNEDAIARAIIALAHSINLTVTAEGVESEEQLAFLREHHCDKVQGYLFSKPLPAADIERLFKSNQSGPK